MTLGFKWPRNLLSSWSSYDCHEQPSLLNPPTKPQGIGWCWWVPTTIPIEKTHQVQVPEVWTRYVCWWNVLGGVQSYRTLVSLFGFLIEMVVNPDWFIGPQIASAVCWSSLRILDPPNGRVCLNLEKAGAPGPQNDATFEGPMIPTETPFFLQPFCWVSFLYRSLYGSIHWGGCFQI